MSTTSVIPNQNSVAATYVIKKGDKTDEIVCYGKETMSASDLEKILKEHFAKMNNTQSTVSQPSTVSKQSDTSVGAALTKLRDAAQKSVRNTMSNVTNTVRKTAQNITENAKDALTTAANKATDTLTEATQATKQEEAKLTAQATDIADKVKTMLPNSQDNVNPNTPAPLPGAMNIGPLSGTITEQSSVKKLGGKRKTKKHKRKGKRKGKKNRKTKKSVYKKKKTRKRKHNKKRKSRKKK